MIKKIIKWFKRPTKNTSTKNEVTIFLR